MNSRALDLRAAQIAKRQDVLIQINTTAEPQKSGCDPGAVDDLIGGIAAMILSRRSDFYIDNRYRDSLPQMIRHIIEGSADDKGAPGRDNHYGWGRVNACHALCNCPHQGDINGDLTIDLFNVIAAIGIAFGGAPDIADPLCPTSRTDVNYDLAADAFDVIYLIGTVFLGGDNPCNPCTPGIPAGCP